MLNVIWKIDIYMAYSFLSGWRPCVLRNFDGCLQAPTFANAKVMMNHTMSFFSRNDGPTGTIRDDLYSVGQREGTGRSWDSWPVRGVAPP